MYFKRFFLAFSLTIIAYSSFAQTKTSKKEADFVTACKGVVKAIYTKDINKLNNYINAKYGVYTIKTRGAANECVNEKKLGKKSMGANYLNFRIEKQGFLEITLQYVNLPEFGIGENDLD